jgi:hypothetical protein
MYIYYNSNPDYLLTNDCTVRAVSKVLDMSWQEVYVGVCVEGGFMHMMPSTNAVWNSYLEKFGFKRYPVSNTCPNCYTIRDFCKDNPYGKYLVATDEHVVAVVDGNYYDTGDCGYETVIYYWKETK